MNQQGGGHIYVSQWHQHGDNMRDDQVYTYLWCTGIGATKKRGDLGHHTHFTYRAGCFNIPEIIDCITLAIDGCTEIQ